MKVLLRAVVALVAVLAAAPAAEARDAACPVKVSSARGAAPLRVTFHAKCASPAYRWRFGDGTTAHGRTVTHTFGGGRFSPVLTTKSGRTKLAPVTSVALTRRRAAPGRLRRHGDAARARSSRRCRCVSAADVFRGGRLDDHGDAAVPHRVRRARRRCARRSS